MFRYFGDSNESCVGFIIVIIIIIIIIVIIIIISYISFLLEYIVQ